jgi:hypothetical protein
MDALITETTALHCIICDFELPPGWPPTKIKGSATGEIGDAMLCAPCGRRVGSEPVLASDV